MNDDYFIEIDDTMKLEPVSIDEFIDELIDELIRNAINEKLKGDKDD